MPRRAVIRADTVGFSPPIALTSMACHALEETDLCRVIQTHHTTVTDFARARGLSILRPKARAV
jgi:hypothetical protein